MVGSGDVEIRLCTPADRGELLALGRRTFADRFDAASCLARLDTGPGDAEVLVVAAFAAGGRCVGMFPSIPLPFLIQGTDQLVHQGALVALDPELASGLAGGPLIHRLSLASFDEARRRNGRLVFGCPEAGLRRVLTSHCGTEVAWDVVPLVRTLDGTRSRPGAGVATSAVPPDDADALWHRVAAQVPTGIVRDRRYLAWRYGERRGRYRFHSLRDPDGALRGLSVVRDGGWHPRTLTIMEWLVPHGDAAGRVLAEQALHEAAARRCEGLVAWFSPAATEYGEFQAQFGFASRASPHQMCLRSLHADLDRKALFSTWYQSAGDLEFL